MSDTLVEGLICPSCNGSGYIWVTSFQDSSAQIRSSCRSCKGSGYLPEDKDTTTARQAALILQLQGEVAALGLAAEAVGRLIAAVRDNCPPALAVTILAQAKCKGPKSA